MSKQFESIMDAVGFPDRYRPLARAIHKQESKSGKMNTSKQNYAGAIGPMQVTKPTFDNLKKQGWIPSSYQFENPDHTTVAGLANIASIIEDVGDDPRRVAAAYYAGPKAIKADGTIKPLRDKKNPKAPDARQYADEVVGTMSKDAYGNDMFIAGKKGQPAKTGKSNLDSLMSDLEAQHKANMPAPANRTQDLLTELQGGDSNPPALPVADMAEKGGGQETQAAPQRTFGQKAGRIGLETLGGIIGGGAGLASPVPGGAYMGSAIGSYGASKLASATFDPLPQDESDKEALFSGAAGLAGPLIGKGLGVAKAMGANPKVMGAGAAALAGGATLAHGGSIKDAGVNALMAGLGLRTFSAAMGNAVTSKILQAAIKAGPATQKGIELMTQFTAQAIKEGILQPGDVENGILPGQAEPVDDVTASQVGQ